MEIREVERPDTELLEALAGIAWRAGRHHAPTWLPTIDDAREEVTDALDDAHRTLVMFDGGQPVGWISTFHLYGQLWEIHPLVVDPPRHGRGVGARLVAEVEAVARDSGAGVMFVGTSDETGSTSVSGRDLFADPAAAIATLDFERGHAVGFWLRMGYRVTGLIPDAEGPGKPSINLAKRLS